MTVSSAPLSETERKFVHTRLRKNHPFLNPKDDAVANIRSWLKHYHPAVRFSVRGNKARLETVAVSWVNYSDTYVCAETIRSSLKHFAQWTRTPVKLPKTRNFPACAVDNRLFTEVFGSIHTLQCLPRAPSDAQRQKREQLLAARAHRKISCAIGETNGQSAGKRLI